MHTSVTFKNLEPSDSLRSYVADKLDRFDKYLDNPAVAAVVFSVEKFRHSAEITLTGDRLNINAEEENQDMYTAIDKVLDKLEKQLKKNKQKIRDKRTGKARARSQQDEAMGSGGEGSDDESSLSIETIEYKPMDVEEAILQMDLLEDDSFFVFTNSRTERVNVLYRKKNGGLGLIEPM
ncbi:MAG: ribosome-associated translation inhibitor RaiA [Proteobacteria bacterium]|nr:ribosome-associated translation inhibitor RaiA [Pseudomonadota bacterium]